MNVDADRMIGESRWSKEKLLQFLHANFDDKVPLPAKNGYQKLLIRMLKAGYMSNSLIFRLRGKD